MTARALQGCIQAEAQVEGRTSIMLFACEAIAVNALIFESMAELDQPLHDIGVMPKGQNLH